LPRYPRVLDDEDGTRTGIARLLNYQYEVVTAADGDEAIRTALREPCPDLVIADVMMPRLDGISMLKCMKKMAALRRIPVILLTAETSSSKMIAGIAAGARGYLLKPIDMELLERKVHSALLDAP
jgi:DNA-binding response OmpR family regulator